MLSREIDYRSLTTLLDHVLAQWAKHNLHTSMPGVIDSYDVAKRRARVRPWDSGLFSRATARERTAK